MTELLLGLQAAGAILGFAGNLKSGKEQRAANRAEASYNIEQLENQLDRLLEQFNENQEQLETALDQTIEGNNQSMWAADISQQNNLEIAGASNEQKQALQYAQLASIQRQGSQSVGATVQSVSTSGFRNTGSAMNIVNETERSAREAYDQAYQQIQLSAYQSFMQAANDYFSANVTIEQYRESSRNAEENFDLQSEALLSQYEYDKERTEAEISYWQGVKKANKKKWYDNLIFW